MLSILEGFAALEALQLGRLPSLEGFAAWEALQLGRLRSLELTCWMVMCVVRLKDTIMELQRHMSSAHTCHAIKCKNKRMEQHHEPSDVMFSAPSIFYRAINDCLSRTEFVNERQFMMIAWHCEHADHAIKFIPRLPNLEGVPLTVCFFQLKISNQSLNRDSLYSIFLW